MRNVTIASLLFLCLLLVIAPLRADEPAAPEKMSAAEIDRLVSQLGAPDFMTRERASRRLLEIGEPARQALEHAMEKSENMEARWRAEQILRRLDRQGEQPVGRPGEVQPLPPAVPPAPGVPQPGHAPRDLRGLLEELLGRRGRGSPFAPDHVLEAPGLRLQINTFGMMATVELRVEGRPGWFMGGTLEDVLRMHPALREHEGMPALIQKWEAFKKSNPRLFPFEGLRPFEIRKPGLRSGLSIVQSRDGVTVTIQEGEDGVTVTIREKDEHGEIVEETYKGESLDAIRRAHPEIADKLEMQVEFGPLVLPRNRRGPLLPVPEVPAPAPPATVPEPPPAQASFGVGLDPVEPVLAMHLGLEPGHGVLVRRVEPGSLAEATGVERHDVIVSIDERPITSISQAVDTLRRVGREKTPVKLEVIRRGRPMTLPR